MMKIALITGGSRGLGRSMALHLARKGHGSIVTYHRREQDAKEVVNTIRDIGGEAVALQLNVTKSDTFPAFADAVRNALEQTWGRARFDFLVNNAGMGVFKPLTQTTEEEFDLLVNAHLRAPLFLTQQLLPLIEDGGKILNVSSGLARFTLPGYAAYAAMKGAVEVLTRYMAKELGERQISVNVLAPGAIETDFGSGAVRDNKDLNAFVAANTALGRAGLPDDIGRATAALLSDEFGWINGQRIEASGGMFL